MFRDISICKQIMNVCNVKTGQLGLLTGTVPLCDCLKFYISFKWEQLGSHSFTYSSSFLVSPVLEGVPVTANRWDVCEVFWTWIWKWQEIKQLLAQLFISKTSLTFRSRIVVAYAVVSPCGSSFRLNYWNLETIWYGNKLSAVRKAFLGSANSLFITSYA